LVISIINLYVINKIMSKETQTAIIILAAGKSSRMKSATSKVLHKVAGWSILQHVLEGAKSLSPERMILVTSDPAIEGGADDILAEGKRICPDIIHAVQKQADGTGGAVRSALPALEGFNGNVLIMYGDSPLMRVATYEKLLDKLEQNHLVITTMTPADPAQYGRIILQGENVASIIEYNDASAEQRKIGLCNAGFMAVRAKSLQQWVGRIQNNNSKSEYYLTDLVAIASHDKANCAYINVAEEETLGVNNRLELAQAEAMMQTRLRNEHLQNGVGMIDPQTIYFHMDTQIGRDVLIHPFVVFGAGVNIADDAEIKSFSHIEGAEIGEGASAGPFARLRAGTKLGENCAIGNFVEIKNSTLHEGAKAGHLSYIGDAEIGSHTNIGAGTITCNYDGKNKHKTSIGKNVFVGSDTSLVAPVTIGNNVTIAAGSVITDDIPENALGIARSRQTNKTDWK
jgi:bifunctional UDP-N-acetylglucosamine pyrophosphorylase/glucosamine-1-phosphate N-acetyltransferase